MKHFTGREMHALDWRALVKDDESAKHRMEIEYARWSERVILDGLDKIVAEYPTATECYFIEYQRGFEKVIEFIGCIDGVWKLPDGMTSPVEVKRVDLTAYKKLVEEGVIKNNTVI